MIEILLGIVFLAILYTLTKSTEEFRQSVEVEGNFNLCLECQRGNWAKCPNPHSPEVLATCK
jgi:hypothetical protein